MKSFNQLTLQHLTSDTSNSTRTHDYNIIFLQMTLESFLEKELNFSLFL